MGKTNLEILVYFVNPGWRILQLLRFWVTEIFVIVSIRNRSSLCIFLSKDAVRDYRMLLYILNTHDLFFLVYFVAKTVNSCDNVPNTCLLFKFSLHCKQRENTSHQLMSHKVRSLIGPAKINPTIPSKNMLAVFILFHEIRRCVWLAYKTSLEDKNLKFWFTGVYFTWTQAMSK